MSGVWLQQQRILTALCAAFLSLLIYELFAPLPAASVPHLRVAAAILPPMMPIRAMAPAQAFSAVSERPLFASSRRKVVPKGNPVEAGAPPALPNISLVGIIIDDQKSLAIVRASDAALASSVAVGDSIGAWRVLAINPDGVVLAFGPDQQEIRLSANRAAPAAAKQIASQPASSTATDISNNGAASH